MFVIKCLSKAKRYCVLQCCSVALGLHADSLAKVPSMKQLGILLLPLDGILVHHRVPSMKQLRVVLLPLDEMLVHHRVPSMKQLGILLLPLDGILVPSQVTQHGTTGGLTTSSLDGHGIQVHHRVPSISQVSLTVCQ